MKTTPTVGVTTALALALTLSACRLGGPDAGPPKGPPEVGVVTLQAENVALSAELPGRTTPYLIAEVRPQVGGILLTRLFEEGSEVQAGQPLYQIDPAPYRATLTRAEAALEQAKLLFERYERLVQSKAISQQDYDDAGRSTGRCRPPPKPRASTWAIPGSPRRSPAALVVPR